MKGNTLQEFMDDLLTCGGPEKEFVYKDKYYIIQGDTLQPEGIPGLKLDIYTRDGDEAGEYIQSMFFSDENDNESVEKFSKAQIFDGKTLYEAEKDIEVLYG